MSCMHAEAEQDAVGQKLRATRDALVDNYVSEQKKLYASLLPKVKSSGKFQALTKMW